MSDKNPFQVGDRVELTHEAKIVFPEDKPHWGMVIEIGGEIVKVRIPERRNFCSYHFTFLKQPVSRTEVIQD